MRRRAARFVLQHVRDRARDARLMARLALMLSRLVGVFRTAARALLGFSFLWRRQIDARAPRFREPDSDRLLRRARAVLAAADILDLFADELTRLCAGGLAGALVRTR